MSMLSIRNETGEFVEVPVIIGPRGPAGEPGRTPVKGTDYWTEVDKQEIGRAISFPGINILHNSEWGYALVNQRALSGAVANEYCIDRWIGNGSVTPVSGKYVTLSSGTTMTQRMEIVPDALVGQEYTFSIDVGGTEQSVTMKFPTTVTGAATVSNVSSCSVELGFLSGSFALCGVTCSYVPYIKITAKAAINVRRVFLEKGNTSHMKYTPTKDISDVFGQCLRYFYLVPGMSRFIRVATVQTNGIYFDMPVPAPMRVKPEMVSRIVAEHIVGGKPVEM